MALACAQRPRLALVEALLREVGDALRALVPGVAPPEGGAAAPAAERPSPSLLAWAGASIERLEQYDPWAVGAHCLSIASPFDGVCRPCAPAFPLVSLRLLWLLCVSIAWMCTYSLLPRMPRIFYCYR